MSSCTPLFQWWEARRSSSSHISLTSLSHYQVYPSLKEKKKEREEEKRKRREGRVGFSMDEI